MILCRFDGAFNNFFRGIIAAHCVNCNFHFFGSITNKSLIPVKKNGQGFYACPKNLLSLSCLNNCFSVIVTAFQTHMVREFRLVASRTFYIVRCFQFPIRTSSVSSGFTQLPFRCCQKNTPPYSAFGFQLPACKKAVLKTVDTFKF